jgi:hypothetical protein
MVNCGKNVIPNNPEKTSIFVDDTFCVNIQKGKIKISGINVKYDFMIHKDVLKRQTTCPYNKAHELVADWLVLNHVWILNKMDIKPTGFNKKDSYGYNEYLYGKAFFTNIVFFLYFLTFNVNKIPVVSSSYETTPSTNLSMMFSGLSISNIMNTELDILKTQRYYMFFVAEKRFVFLLNNNFHTDDKGIVFSRLFKDIFCSVPFDI